MQGMIAVSGKRMREIEDRIFRQGVSAELLMEQAGRGIAEVVSELCPQPGHIVVYAGKGNNAGDALVAARELRKLGWRVYLREGFSRSEWSALAVKKCLELGSDIEVLKEAPQHLRGAVVLLDGLLGLGFNLHLREPVAALCREMRGLRQLGALVVAVDLPTGVDADSGEVDEAAVVADVTATLGLPKAGLLTDQATAHVGRIAVIALDRAEGIAHELKDESEGNLVMPTSKELREALPARRLDCHKGDCGRVAILGGSPGFTGAAILAAASAARAGAGLVTLFALREIYPILAAAAPPEVMVTPLASPAALPVQGFDSLVIGPGLGRAYDQEILHIIEKHPAPCVVDADALNALATKVSVLGACRGQRLLTPHPGEMARLANTQGKTRWEVAMDFAEQYPKCTLLLKGARTLVAESGKPVSTNQTGIPALATGGSGDCLAGICGALIAQGLSPYLAGQLGAWLHGQAAQCAIVHGHQSAESFSASDLPSFLGYAFRSLRQCVL